MKIQLISGTLAYPNKLNCTNCFGRQITKDNKIESTRCFASPFLKWFYVNLLHLFIYFCVLHKLKVFYSCNNKSRILTLRLQ